MSEAVPLTSGAMSVPTMGPDADAADAAVALLAGTRVAEFEIRGVLGSGGFGIVYLAWDHALEREVALKEYMPGTLAGRGSGLAVSVRSQAMADTYALGLRSFVNEARMLARFDHPSLVKVYRFWEDNGTAYMVMQLYHGRTLRKVRAGMVVPPGEAACRRVLDALLSALEVLHREGVFHRDIAPDNILIGDDGMPVLLDFGAARRVIGEGQKALTSIMKPHFAPLEQYADQSAMRQGPWTDLYALGGTLYFLITGREPVPAASRALHDDQPRLRELQPSDCSPGFLATLDWMMALKPPERPQSVQMLRDVLEGRITMPGRQPADRTTPGVASRDTVDIYTGPGEFDEVGTGAAAAAAASSRTVLLEPTAPAAAATDAAPAASAAPAAGTRHLRSSMLLAVLLVLNMLAWWWFTRREAAPQPAPVAVVASPAAASAPLRAASTAAAAGTARDSAGTETILSVLPARPPRAASAAAIPAASAARGAEVSPALPRTTADAARAASAPAPRADSAPAPMLDNAGPRARCGERNFLALLVCMKRECDNPALRSHPECVKMREQEEAGTNPQR
jgi:hypothetical protein